jgi:hypothetical protein
MLLISDLLILTCQKHGVLKILFKKTFQANLFVFAILIAFYIHYKPYEIILERRSNTGKSLDMVCADFKCQNDIINVSEILQNFENKGLLMATCLFHQNGRMECWNVGVLGIKAEIKHYNCKKLLQTHYSIIPLFQLERSP